MDSTHPGNIIKFCPKCGSSSFDYDGSKAFKCQTCTFHFFINSACAVAAIIVDEKGRILLTRRAFDPCAGMLDLPGGFVDPLESAEESVIREIKEELNLDITSLKFLKSFPNEYVFSAYTVFTTDLGFICQVTGFDNMHAQDDINGFEFVAPDQINFNELSSISIKNIVKAYIDSI